MTRFMPAGVGTVQARAVSESLEEYWRMMGVVPRYRYLEVLERNEQLRRQLEEADRTIQQLQPMANAVVPQEEAQKMFNLWGSMLEETMKAQQEMLRTWTAPKNQDTDSSSTSE
jgi:flagellar biosynthesis/type III secretory pathway chaperone